MKNKYLIVATLTFLIFSACKKDNDSGGVVQLDDKFDTSEKGWTVDYADYVLNPTHPDEFEHGISQLPPPLNNNGKGLKISGKKPKRRPFYVHEKESYRFKAQPEIQG
jgi:hypothetical protein